MKGRVGGVWLWLGVFCLLLGVSASAQRVLTSTPPAAALAGNAGEMAPAGAADSWRMTEVYRGGFTIGMTAGAGRNDKIVRLYGTNISTNTVKEFTFDGKAWVNSSLSASIALPFYSEKSLELANGRNDNVLRLYVGEFNFGGGVREYTWNGEAWSGAVLPSAGQQLINMTTGDARNEGVLKLYFATGSSPPFNVGHEYTFLDTAWRDAPIAAPPDVIVGSFGIDVGDARNDGFYRIYEGVLGGASFQVYEYTWNGASYEAALVADTGSGLPAQVMGVAVGNGRNDGVLRLYVVRRGVGVNEYTYFEGAWLLTSEIPIGSELFGIAIGYGRNDDVNRLYVVQRETGTLWEASYKGEKWSVANVGTTAGTLFQVKLADARGDGVQRLYVAGSNGLSEFTYIE